MGRVDDGAAQREKHNMIYVFTSELINFATIGNKPIFHPFSGHTASSMYGRPQMGVSNLVKKKPAWEPNLKSMKVGTGFKIQPMRHNVMYWYKRRHTIESDSATSVRRGWL
jgi:hypothetical protein